MSRKGGPKILTQRNTQKHTVWVGVEGWDSNGNKEFGFLFSNVINDPQLP